MTVMPNIDYTMRINDDLIEKWEPKIYKMLQNAYIEGWEKEGNPALGCRVTNSVSSLPLHRISHPNFHRPRTSEQSV